jgi:hypothetical protein
MYKLKIDNYYLNGRIAPQVFENGVPYARLSINAPEVPLKENEFILNHDLNHYMFTFFLKEMEKTGKVKPTGKTCNYGFVRDQPIWELMGEEQ